MKKIFLTILILAVWNTMTYSQDTMCVYMKRSPIVTGYYPYTYQTSQVDSVTLSASMDAILVFQNKKAPIEFLLAELDSITFKKPGFVDYTSITGFDVLVNSAYSFLKYLYGKEDGMGMSEMGTDLWTAGEQAYTATGIIPTDNRFLTLYQNLSSTNSNVTRLWKQFYAGVNACNLGIKIIADKGFSNTDTRYLRGAELRFLRAFYYWHIVETWGGVHFTTQPFYTPLFKENKSPVAFFMSSADKTPVATFYNQIISDLNLAINDLPTVPSQNGRVTKSAAKAFLARVYLTRGYINNSSSDFTAARDLATDVMDDGYAMLSKYESLWDMTKQNNSEIIWSVIYEKDLNLSDGYNPISNPYGYGVDISNIPSNNRGNNNLHTLFIPPYDRSFDSATYSPGTNGFDKVGNSMLMRDIRNGHPSTRFVPTKFLMDLFDEAKDARYKGSFQTVWKVNNNSDNTSRTFGKVMYVDTALYITKNPIPPQPAKKYYYYNIYDMYNADGSSKNVLNNTLCPALLKFQDSTRYQAGGSPNDLGNGNTISEKDVFVIRLAEMYMIAGEAEYKLGNIGAAVTQLNFVRARAEITPGLLTSTTMAELVAGGIDFILDERAREFAGEQIRWFDLKRTGKLLDRVKAFNPEVSPYIQPYHNLRPIPQAQLNALTSGNLGY